MTNFRLGVCTTQAFFKCVLTSSLSTLPLSSKTCNKFKDFTNEPKREGKRCANCTCFMRSGPFGFGDLSSGWPRTMQSLSKKQYLKEQRKI
jgi:hypothetical protein